MSDWPRDPGHSGHPKQQGLDSVSDQESLANTFAPLNKGLVFVSMFLLFLVCQPALAQLQSGTLEETEDQKSAAEDDQGGESDAVPTDVQQRELGAEEDPLARDQAQRKVDRAEEKEDVGKEPERATGFDVYGSVRLRFRDQGGDQEWQDGGSRMGGDIEWQFREGSFLFSRYEAGFNALTAAQDLNQGKDSSEEFEDSIFTRLFYVGIDAPWFTGVVGKNWSTYYKVAVFTDRFEGTGGAASGTYNAQTDGGPTGPGRADQVLLTKLEIDFLPQTKFKPFNLNLQAQHGNPIPFGGGVDYETALGMSAVLTTHNDLTIGFAYNHAMINVDANPSLRGIGITGDARAALAGVRGFGDRWYAGLVVSRLENHETTDDGIYFEGWGSEFYGQYQLFNRVWLVGGLNVLEPDSDQVQARDYRVRYLVAGLRYTFNEFRQMIYANVQIDDSIDADGSPRGNVYTVGVRWDLSKRGWHVSSKN